MGSNERQSGPADSTESATDRPTNAVAEAETSTETRGARFSREAHRVRLYIYAGAAVVLLVCLTAVILANTGHVKVSWVFGTSSVSLVWLALFALVGVGLTAMPRRVAGLLVAAVAVPTLALSIATTHTETSSFIPELEARVGPNDLVAASWDHYLVLLDEAGPTVRARLHVAYRGNPPWWLGTAAYPPGALIHAVPAGVVASGGRVFWVAGPGAVLPGLPAGYRSLDSRCAVLVCLTVYGPSGG